MKNDVLLSLSGGVPVHVAVRRSERARRIRLRVTESGPELVVPVYADMDAALEFLRSQSLWLETALKQNRREPLTHPSELRLAFTGEHLKLVYEAQDVVWMGVRYRSPTELLVSGNTAEASSCIEALRQWLMRKAKLEILPFAADICSELNFEISGFTLGLQLRVWGTCNSKRRIALNAALLFFPREIVRYVVIHEGCHLTEMNHSVRFWNLVKKYYPYPEHARRILNGRDSALPAWVHAKL